MAKSSKRKRVADTLTSRAFKLVCSLILSLLLVLGLIAFILWLSLRPHRPRFFINYFSVIQNGDSTARVLFNTTARNSNANIGIHYTSMNASVYYRSLLTGSTPLPHFPLYQQPKSSDSVNGEVGGSSLQLPANSGNGAILFRLEMISVIRFQLSSWMTGRHTMHTDCEVDVGEDGIILDDDINKRCSVYFS